MAERRTRRNGRWAPGLLLAVLGLATGARAEESAEPEGAVTPPVVVEAVRPAELPDDPSSFTTVIETEAFRGEAQDLAAMIEGTPGVQVRRFGGPGAPVELSIRGSSSSQVVVLLDGVRLNSSQSGAVDLSTVPPELVERIEVSRGGGSVQTGSDAIGGVVNIVTRRPTGNRATTWMGSTGSFGTWQASATQTGGWRGNEFALGYEFFKTDGDWDFEPLTVKIDGRTVPSVEDSIERVNNQTENHAALVRMGRDLGDRWRVDLTNQFFYGSSGRPGLATPGGPLAGQSLTAHLRRLRNVASATLTAADPVGLGVDSTLRLFHRYERRRFLDEMPTSGLVRVDGNGQVIPATGDPAFDEDGRNHTYGGRLAFDHARAIAFSDHRATLGLEVRRDDLRQKEDIDPDRTSTGVWVQDEIAFLEGRLRLIPALRFDHTDGFGTEWIPRLGVIASPLPWLRLKGNVERAYRVPTFEELYFDEDSIRGNPFLDAEDSFNADVGFEVGLARLGPLTDLRVELAYYHQDIDESVVFQLISPSVVGATNTGSAQIDGVEFAAGLRLLGWIGFSASLTHQNAELDRSGSALPGRADDEHTLRLELGPPDGRIKWVGERHYTSSIPARAGGGSSIQSRATYDTSLAVDLRQLPRIGERLPLKRLLFSVTATNVTDESVRDALFFPQPGRSLTFRVEGSL